MDDDAQTNDRTDTDTAGTAVGGSAPEPDQPDLPERLRVHSLARVLGTTSRKVLDALIELDGRTRSAHSSVDRVDAVRVRDVLAAAQAAEAAESTSNADAPEAAETPEVTDPAEAPAEVESEAPAEQPAEEQPVAPAIPEPVLLDPFNPFAVTAEPESRLMLETPEPAPEPKPEPEAEPERTVADYLPLFVAPQPVVAVPADDEDDEVEDADVDEAADSDTDETAESDEQSERPSNRRRRRGRRGRGRGRGGDSASEGSDSDSDDEDAESSEAAAESADGEAAESAESEESDEQGEDEGTQSDGTSRRRRRRRRRKSGSGDDSDATSPDDPPNTVVHERPPREKSREIDEIQGISGSTRLEAKRQRRRDGRDAGRRRPPILSEAEFLARREAVERTMIVRDKIRTEPPHEGARYTQIAVLEDGVVVEHFVTSAASASLVGNIYLGIVQNVLPSMEAAFVDIGRGRNGVLYAGEVNWEAAGLGGQNRKIEQALKPGDYVVVQVSKDPVGHKGARLTTQVSLAGRYLVYVPGASSTGISRKLPDTERQRLKEILREVVPSDAGVIIRTASEGVKEEDIRSDVERLQKRWTEIEAKAAEITAKKAGAAVALYEEPDVLVKVIRDLFNEDFSSLIVSGDHAWNTINEYVNSVAPELLPKMTKYDHENSPDVFAVHRIDEQLAKAMDRKVWLPSGGTLVIDRTEAMTVVDVNTGKFTGAGGNLEQTVTKNNLEAAEEIVRQLRLRDIGGIVVIDFIDMVLESNRDLVLRRLTEALARDRTRHQVSEVTSLGLVQLTRKRLGTGLVEAFSTTCTHCAGRGIVLHSDPIDSAPPAGRGKSESGGGGGKRGKRGKKSKTEDAPVVAKLPPHPVGEHPMFKAMAAANGRHDDESGHEDHEHDHEHDVVAAPVDDVDTADETLTEDLVHESVGEERADDVEDDVEDVDDIADIADDDADSDDDYDDEDSDDEDSDDDVDETDEIDLDDDDADSDDDIDLVDAEDESDDEDDSHEDEDDAEDDEDTDEEEPAPEPVVVTRPRRRRAAVRAAGPPR